MFAKEHIAPEITDTEVSHNEPYASRLEKLRMLHNYILKADLSHSDYVVAG